MLKSYLKTIAMISYGFTDIVEEYLPGVFDPIRMEKWSRWYPKPIIVTACVFAEWRILRDSRTAGEWYSEEWEWCSDEDGLDKSDRWDVMGITVEFMDAMEELERRGLEVSCVRF